MAKAQFSTLTLVLLFALGCGNGNGNGNGNGDEANQHSGASAGGSANGTAASGTGATGLGGKLVIELGGSQNSGGAATPGDGTPELCDGIDNDSNGIIDDVDAGGDGVCDCLNIATIGHIGPWSNGGNIFAAWLDARSPLGAVELADEELTAEKLAPFQIVVVLHAATSEVGNGDIVAPAHHAFSDAESDAFDAWVRGGGGVMTTIGYTFDEGAEIGNVNKLLSKLGMGYSTTKLDLGGDISTWMPHPISTGISNIFTDNGVEPDVTNGTTVATGSGTALQVLEVDNGRIAVWGDEWITYDSEWADVEGQQVERFWLNLLKWLSPPTQCQVPIPPRVK